MQPVAPFNRRPALLFLFLAAVAMLSPHLADGSNPADAFINDGMYTKEMVVQQGTATNSQAPVCLDGSPAAYYVRPPAAGGEKKWYLHFEGGGWCVDLPSCLVRAGGMLGSSKTYPTRMVPYQDRGYFNTSVAYFSPDPIINPMMYNWGSVFVRYGSAQLSSSLLLYHFFFFFSSLHRLLSLLLLLLPPTE